MTNHHDALRVAPDPVRAEELRRRLHARIEPLRLDLHEPPGVEAETGSDEREANGHGRRSSRTLVVVLAAAAVLALVVGAVALLRLDEDATGPITTDPPPTTTTVPALDRIPDGAVWYDESGLHHGETVEPTPVDLVQRIGTDSTAGALALVRSGALYLGPATDEVWFHPWGGTPRIVGQSSPAGPGGDPNGDTAAWFEGESLVVYDTAAGREVARSSQGVPPVVGCSGICGDHYPAGNGFLQVSADRVVWYARNVQGGGGVMSYDVATGTTSVAEAGENAFLIDAQGPAELVGRRGLTRLTLRVEGDAEQHFADLESRARLSPSGNHVLAVEDTEARHGAVILDTRTGERWPVPKEAYPWIAWSYDDVAMIDHTDDELLACDAARRACEALQPDGEFLLPTN